MEEIKKLLVGFVSKTLKLDEESVTSELFESEGDTLKAKMELNGLCGKMIVVEAVWKLAMQDKK